MKFMSRVGSERVISDRSFVDEQFDDLVIGSSFGLSELVELTNVTFVKCNVTPGEFRIGMGVRLANVEFQDCVVPEGYLISSSVVLDHVRFVGGPERSSLWVKPFETEQPYLETAGAHYDRYAESTIDVSRFGGSEVAIVGLPVLSVQIDERRHFRVPPKLVNWGDWTRAGISMTSIWRMRVKYVRSFRAQQGVFSIPALNPDKRTIFDREGAILRSLDLL